MCFHIILSAIAKYVLYMVFAPQIFRLTFYTHIRQKVVRWRCSAHFSFVTVKDELERLLTKTQEEYEI
jgi:hypothetical protein